MLKVLLATLAVLFAVSGCAMAVETPSYQVEAKAGQIEVRAYAPLLAAEVRVRGERRAAINRGFRTLADYIFGNNTAAAKVAMTAPVTQSASEKIEMTAPVTQSQAGEGAWAVRFILPAEYTLQTVPRPNDPAVALIEEPARRFAAIRFSGGASESALAAKENALRDYLAANQLVATGPAVYAFYDPPWTPPFLRRNEILVPLK